MPLLSIRTGQFVVSSSIITMLGDPNSHEVALQARKLSRGRSSSHAIRGRIRECRAKRNAKC